MRQKVWKQFFYYAPFEKRAIVFLLGMSIVLLAAPRHFFLRPPQPLALSAADSVWLFQLKEQKARAIPSAASMRERSVQPRRIAAPFNPNQVDTAELLAMGVSPRAANNWMRYLEKGGAFKSVAEVGRIYGLDSEVLQQMTPYLIFSPTPASRAPRQRTTGCTPMDINTADSAAWEALPGIGSVLAARIIRFRDRLGGFMNPEQVSETYGLSDSTFANILPCLKGGGVLVRISVNTATLEELGGHPYIGFKTAKALMAYRRQHGGFESLDDLLRFPAWTGTAREKATPYIDVQVVVHEEGKK